MTDQAIRTSILEYLYQHRDAPRSDISPESIGPDVRKATFNRVMMDLLKAGLIEGHDVRTFDGPGVLVDRISGAGIDVMEGNAPSPVALNVHNDNRSFSIGTMTGGAAMQGDHSTQNVSVHLQALVEAVQASNMSDTDKRTALDKLKGFATSPGVANGLQLGSLAAQLFGTG